ncbi:MAG: hypothetical protein AB1721_00875 [Patescibacteria group bacterium]
MLESILNTFPETTIEHRLIKSLALFFDSTNWLILSSFLKTVSLLVSFFLFGLTVYLFIKLKVLKGKIDKIKAVVKSSGPSQTAKKFTWQMKKIKKRLSTNSAEDDRLALIEAEELFRQALEGLNIKGQPIPELIRQTPLWREVKPEELLKAHDLRNQAVHYFSPLVHSEAEEAVEIYEKGLKDLGFL